MSIIRLFLALAIIITSIVACDEPPSGKIKTQTPAVSQSKGQVAEPPTVIKQQTPPSQGSLPVPPQAQPPATPPIQPNQPAGAKSLNVPAYLFIEGQTEKNNSNNTIAQASPGSSMEDQILLLVNKARTSSGLGQVKRDSYLDSLALRHSQDMVQTNVMSHDGFDARAHDALNTIRAHCVAENVAMGYTSAAALVQGWLDSPGHRQNIMNPVFSKIGIGIAGIFATQMFSD